MIGLGIGEIVILLIIGVFWLAALLAVFVVIGSRRGGGGSATRPMNAPPQPRATILARLPLFIAIWIFSLICLVVAVGGAYFVGFGDPPLRLMIVIGLLLFGLFTAVLI